MKGKIFKQRDTWMVEEEVTHVHYEIIWNSRKPPYEGQIVMGKIVEHSNQDRIHQNYFEVSHESNPPTQEPGGKWTDDDMISAIESNIGGRINAQVWLNNYKKLKL